MADIQTYLNNIMKAVLGKDVRQSIHDSIKQCYYDGKAGAIDLDARERAAAAEARMDTFTKLSGGSTTGYAELNDIRVGLDGKIYSTAGTAVREQLRNTNTIEVKNTEPTKENTQLWLRPSESDTFNLPEINDNDINPDDTWSSEKINDELSIFSKYIEAGIEDDLIGGTYSSATKESDTSMKDCTTTLATPSQAYFNGFVPDRDILIKGLRLKGGTTATSFSVYVFDSSDTLVRSYINITPTISSGIVTFDSPIELKAGQYALVRFLNGTGYYIKALSNIYKEYQPGTATLMDSPIKMGFEFIYSTKTFKPAGGRVKLSEHSLPKCKEADGEYTFIGRWFDKVISGVSRKCTNADGSSILFKVSGASTLRVALSTITTPSYTPYFAYSIDGGAFVRQLITTSTISLPDAGEHIVWIVVDGMGENDPYAGGKWSGSVGVCFNGITGGTKTALSYSNKSILFVGDSIVEGINTLGAGSTANDNSAVNGFAFKTARMLNAIPLMCGYGGTAVLGNASFHKPIDAIDYNMDGVPVNDMSPDIVVIEHGYNDGTLVSNGSFTETDFVTAYNKLVDRIRIKYPGVPIVCMIPFKQSLAAQIRSCAESKSGCYVVETKDYDLTYTDTAHLNSNGATVAADELSNAIIDLFGKSYFVC